MARRRKSGVGLRKPRKLGTEEINRQKYMGRANSGQIDSPRFGFSTRKLGKLDVCVFYAKFAAKKFLDRMIADDEIEWIDDQELHTSGGLEIRGEQLRKIYDHRVTYNEERYHSFGEGYTHRISLIRSDNPSRPFIAGESQTSRRRTSRKGMTLMKTIAEELGMTPRVARGILRANMKKPEHGWAWRTTAEIDRIKALLSGKPNRRTIDFSKAGNNELEEGREYRPLVSRTRRAQDSAAAK